MADDLSVLPTDLDRERLAALEPGGWVAGEAGYWSIILYPPKPANRPDWCQWVLVLQHPILGAVYGEWKLPESLYLHLNHCERKWKADRRQTAGES